MFYNTIQECVGPLFLHNLHILCKTTLKYLYLMGIHTVFKTMNFIWLEVAQSNTPSVAIFILCFEIKYKATQDLMKQDICFGK